MVAAQLGVWVLLLGLMLGIGSLLSRVERGSTVEEVDAGVPTWLAARRTDALDAVSGVAAELGNTTVVLVLAVLASAVAALVWRGWRPVAVIAVVLVGEVAIFPTTSAVIDRERAPVLHLDDKLPPTSSFLSGHTAAICLYGAVAALVLAATHRRRHYAVVGGAALLVLVVALARPHRGAHYPTDVLGSRSRPALGPAGRLARLAELPGPRAAHPLDAHRLTRRRDFSADTPRFRSGSSRGPQLVHPARARSSVAVWGHTSRAGRSMRRAGPGHDHLHRPVRRCRVLGVLLTVGGTALTAPAAAAPPQKTAVIVH